jgi:hypothetical protein
VNFVESGVFFGHTDFHPESYAEWYWWSQNNGPGSSDQTWEYHLDTYGPDVVYDDFIQNFTKSRNIMMATLFLTCRPTSLPGRAWLSHPIVICFKSSSMLLTSTSLTYTRALTTHCRSGSILTTRSMASLHGKFSQRTSPTLITATNQHPPGPEATQPTPTPTPPSLTKATSPSPTTSPT